MYKRNLSALASWCNLNIQFCGFVTFCDLNFQLFIPENHHVFNFIDEDGIVAVHLTGEYFFR